MADVWLDALGRIVDGRPVLLAGAVPAAWSAYLPLLEEAGAERVMIYSPLGPGLQPGPPDVPVVSVPAVDGLGPTEVVRHITTLLAEPPADVVDAVDDFDPHRRAVGFGPFTNEAPTVAGRTMTAYRRPEWIALEDKLLADEIWDAAGVARRQSVVAELGEATQAALALDRGAGTVWAADASAGFHGGGDGVRWVTNADEAHAAVAELSEFATLVRVMPFVDGIPCSIHGVVLAEGTAALRPVEMVVLRQVDTRQHRFVYRGCASFWDPTDAIREQMRAAAKAVGEVLRDRVEFRGAFSIDGVVDADGFWPTELNPRFGAGLFTFDAFDGPPLTLVNDLIVADAVGLTAAEFEAAVLPSIDARRGGGTWGAAEAPELSEPIELDLAWAQAGWKVATAPEGGVAAVDARVWIGPHATRCVFDPDTTPIGPSVSPRAAAFWNEVIPQFGGDRPDLTPAG